MRKLVEESRALGDAAREQAVRTREFADRVQSRIAAVDVWLDRRRDSDRHG